MKKLIALILLIGIVFFGVYLLYLYQRITSKFEYHRWNLPSRVYSESYPLYPGKPATQKEILEKLSYLEYKKVSQPPSHHGQFRQEGNHFEIFLHSFQYPHKKFEGFPISFEIQNGKLDNIFRTDSQQPLYYSTLEPELIASIFDRDVEDRTVVSIDKVPDILIQAIIAIEDERFYDHHGIDPRGIARAFFVNLTSGRIVQGGSTLTQQLVKNFFLHARKSYVRKFNEMLMAFLMELRYSKEEILEAYLNEIYLGQRGAASIAGVEEASRYYFSKKVGQLTLEEAALLAGLIRSPGHYSPVTHPKRSRDRRNLILKKLKEKNLISAEEYEKSRRIAVKMKSKKKQERIAPHFIDYVTRELRENFPLSKLRSEGLKIFTTLDMTQQRAAVTALTTWLDRLEKDRPYLKKKAEEGKFLEGAFIALQPQSGFIRAYVGGRDYQRIQFDHVSGAKRQTGSAFKPFVYLTALDPERQDPPFTLSSMVDDQPLTVKSGGSLWSPKNYDKKFHGKVRLRTALEKSYNVSSVWLGLQIGLDKVVKTAKEAGIESSLKPYPSIVLGSFELSPLELAAAYTIFPNQGTRTKPVAVRQVVTSEGEVLEKKDIEMKRLFDPSAIYLMNRLMMGVINQGTAASSRARGFYGLAAGKTGTTSDYRDAWFVGYTPELLALSWVGYDDNKPTNLSGASGALPIWTEFMKKVTGGKRYSDFPSTDEIVIVAVDKKTGLLPHRLCATPMDEYFIEGTEPKVDCYKGRKEK